MILYCDTSALAKLYIAEAQSDVMRQRLAQAEAVAVCRIAWAEFHAALARRGREAPQDRPVLMQAKASLAADWPRYVVIEVTQQIVERAGEYADLFALRAYDAIQLAAAAELLESPEPEVAFVCYDERLNRAARALRLQCAVT